MTKYTERDRHVATLLAMTKNGVIAGAAKQSPQSAVIASAAKQSQATKRDRHGPSHKAGGSNAPLNAMNRLRLRGVDELAAGSINWLIFAHIDCAVNQIGLILGSDKSESWASARHFVSLPGTHLSHHTGSM
jgi:hypothetical protein